MEKGTRGRNFAVEARQEKSQPKARKRKAVLGVIFSGGVSCVTPSRWDLGETKTEESGKSKTLLMDTGLPRRDSGRLISENVQNHWTCKSSAVEGEQLGG